MTCRWSFCMHPLSCTCLGLILIRTGGRRWCACSPRLLTRLPACLAVAHPVVTRLPACVPVCCPSCTQVVGVGIKLYKFLKAGTSGSWSQISAAAQPRFYDINEDNRGAWCTHMRAALGAGATRAKQQRQGDDVFRARSSFSGACGGCGGVCVAGVEHCSGCCMEATSCCQAPSPAQQPTAETQACPANFCTYATISRPVLPCRALSCTPVHQLRHAGKEPEWFLEIDAGDIDARADSGLNYVADPNQRRLTFAAAGGLWSLRFPTPETYRAFMTELEVGRVWGVAVVVL